MHLLNLVLIFFFLIFLVMAFSIVFWTLKNGIGPMPSSPKAIQIFKQHLPKEFQGNVLELGCGWGSLLKILVEAYPQKTIYGFENSWVPYLFTKARFYKQQNLILSSQNFLNIPFENTGLIVCYLYPKAMVQIKEKIEKEVRNDLWIVSLVFAVPNWTPYEVYEVPDLYHSKIYLYRIKF